jgi:hypothetical protein
MKAGRSLSNNQALETTGAGRLIEREDLDFKEEKRKPLTNAKSGEQKPLASLRAWSKNN